MDDNLTVIVKWIEGSKGDILIEKQSLLRALENAKNMYRESIAISTMESLIAFITAIGA